MENMFNLNKIFGSKDKQEPVQKKDINQLRSELQEKINEREDWLGRRYPAGSNDDMKKVDMIKTLDDEVSKLKSEVAEKESEHKIAA